MNRFDYLKLAVTYKAHYQLGWIISNLAVTKEDPKAYQSDPYPYRLVKDVDGIRYLDSNGELSELIDGSRADQALFKLNDRITVTTDICPNVNGEIETTVGNLLFNLIVLVYPFGSKLAFRTGRCDVGKIENEIAQLMESTPENPADRDEKVIYVDEYKIFGKVVTEYWARLAPLTSLSYTEKMLRRAPGIDEYKSKLIKEYGDRLKEPVVFAEFEEKLKAFDDKYMAGDRANGRFLYGKIKNIARKKKYLTIGIDLTLDKDQSPVPIINSLTEGWPTDPEQFVAYMNGSRAGSDSKGRETINGGVAGKIVIRAGSSMRVTEEDCGSTNYLSRDYREYNIKNLVGREVFQDNHWALVSSLEEANSYLNTTVKVRSPGKCWLEGDQICKRCAGRNIAENPNGIRADFAEVSQSILTTSLKVMHGKVLSLQTLDLEDVLS